MDGHILLLVACYWLLITIGNEQELCLSVLGYKVFTQARSYRIRYTAVHLNGYQALVHGNVLIISLCSCKR